MNMRSFRPALLLIGALGLASCADMTPTQQSMGIGALGGAALGGVVGSFSGNAGLGALLGAGVGAGGGYLYEQSRESRQSRYDRGYRRYPDRGYN